MLLYLNLFPMNINHGPYLQEVTNTSATFVFNTSLPSYSYMELKKYGEEEGKVYCQSVNGLKQANCSLFAVRADDLLSATIYNYRIISKEIKSLQPYSVVYGDSVVSPWYSFSTLNPKQKGGNFFITSDMHNNPDKLKTLLTLCDYESCSMIFYVGDMMNYMQENAESPFTAFIDLSVEMFAKSKPFEVVRGNHETRGNNARTYSSFYRKDDWKLIYYYHPEKREGSSCKLFNLKNDPYEREEVSSQNPKIVRRLFDGMKRRLESEKALYPVDENKNIVEPELPEYYL